MTTERIQNLVNIRENTNTFSRLEPDTSVTGASLLTLATERILRFFRQFQGALMQTSFR